MQLSLHRRNGRLEGSRCFSRGALLEIMKNHYLAVFGRKANNSTTKRLGPFESRQRLERRLNGRGERIEIAVRLTGWPAPLPAKGLQSLIDRYPDNPSAKTGFRPEGRQTKPDLKHDLLKEIIAVRNVLYHRTDASLHRA
jgi:hypothetical protein